MSIWKSDETLLSICILNFSFKNDFVWEEIYTSKFVKNTPLRVVFSTLLCRKQGQVSKLIFEKDAIRNRTSNDFEKRCICQQKAQ